MSAKNLKRAAAEDLARSHILHSDDNSSKKARFDNRNPSTLAADAGDEDAILELDEIGKGGAQAKRKAVRLEGYESDSSNENFDARAEAKAKTQKNDKRKQQKSQDEEANDMFADLDEDFNDADDDEDLAREGKMRKKEVRFMDEKEIEGQVSSSKSGGHVSADFTAKARAPQAREDASSSTDESGDDEERDVVGDEVDDELGAGSKKRKAPKLDAFNMRNETEEGKFDESGNFVRNATDPFAVHDSWLEGSSKKDMKRAKEAEEKRENARRKRDMADDALSTGDLLSSLISCLDEGETALEALARIGSSKNKKRRPQPRRKGSDDGSMDVDGNEKEDMEENKRKEAVEKITAAADQLLTRGQPEIYEAERALLLRQYRRETGEDWVDTSQHESTESEKSWEFRWADARDGGEAHGPYEERTMMAWSKAGYFGEGVEFRKRGGTEWHRSVKFE